MSTLGIPETKAEQARNARKQEEANSRGYGNLSQQDISALFFLNMGI